LGSARAKGTLKKWLDDKGYGFITPDKGSQDVFVHLSAFDRDIPRKPKVGDTIFYHVTTDNNGKTKAVDAAIEGAAAPVKRPRSPKPKHLYQDRRKKSSWKFLVICLVLIIGIGSTLYDRFHSTGGQILSSSTNISNFIGSKPAQQYTCSGKTHCSQMTSCEEATFYLQNCPGTSMDGDGDGIPCERQHCN
jgi:cold shock CspA family protein